MAVRGDVQPNQPYTYPIGLHFGLTWQDK